MATAVIDARGAKAAAFTTWQGEGGGKEEWRESVGGFLGARVLAQGRMQGCISLGWRTVPLRVEGSGERSGRGERRGAFS